MNISKPLRLPGIIVQDIGTGLVLSSTEGKVVHVLNPTAKFIWGLCDGQHTVEDIEQEIRANFSVGGSRDVKGDIQRTLTELADKGLLQMV